MSFGSDTSERLTDGIDHICLAGPSANSTHKPCRLMAMPRELRDQIYDNLTKEYNLGNPFSKYRPFNVGYTQISVKAGPRAVMMRVNKQFSSEYNQRIRDISVLSIRDLSGIRYVEAAVPSLVEPMKYIQHVKLEFLIDAYHRFCRVEEIAYDWMKLLQLLSPHPHSLEGRIEIEVRSMTTACYYPEDLPTAIHFQRPGASSYEEWYGHQLPNAGLRLSEGSVDRCGISRVEIRCNSDGIWRVGDKLARRSTVYGTWTKQQGWRSGKIDCRKDEDDSVSATA
jgi:hypothetical protein